MNAFTRHIKSEEAASGGQKKKEILHSITRKKGREGGGEKGSEIEFWTLEMGFSQAAGGKEGKKPALYIMLNC